MSVHDASGVIRKGGSSWSGRVASTVELDEVPSPQMILVFADLGLVSPFIVGLRQRPAPVSMMMSPSRLFAVCSSSDNFLFGIPGSKGNSSLAWLFDMWHGVHLAPLYLFDATMSLFRILLWIGALLVANGPIWTLP